MKTSQNTTWGILVRASINYNQIDQCKSDKCPH